MASPLCCCADDPCNRNTISQEGGVARDVYRQKKRPPRVKRERPVDPVLLNTPAHAMGAMLLHRTSPLRDLLRAVWPVGPDSEGAFSPRFRSYAQSRVRLAGCIML